MYLLRLTYLLRYKYDVSKLLSCSEGSSMDISSDPADSVSTQLSTSGAGKKYLLDLSTRLLEYT